MFPVMILLAFTIPVPDTIAQAGFRDSQLAYPRVRQAYAEKWDTLRSRLTRNGLERERLELYLVAYKLEKKFEVWARNRGDERFRRLCHYDICATSGSLGPKRVEGDRQIPEGFYHISVFNPASTFHLSLCINYPNDSDRVLSDREHPGGNICIHGSCVTIGCVPLTDEVIKELYLLCVEARNNGQAKIPVTIYPARLNPLNYGALVLLHQGDTASTNLWSDLKRANDLFAETGQMPRVTYLENGRHLIE